VFCVCVCVCVYLCGSCVRACKSLYYTKTINTSNGFLYVCPELLTGHRITPSFVSWTPDGQRLIGDSAKAQATLNPLNTIYDAKRLIGRKYSDLTVQSDMQHLPFKIVKDENDLNDRPMIEVEVSKNRKKRYTPEEVSAMVSKNMYEL
jgi:molecular chaperone DnaK (HSP70)